MNSLIPKIATYTYIDNTKEYSIIPLDDPRMVKMLKDIYVVCKKEETEFIKLINFATNAEQVCRVDLQAIEQILRKNIS